MNFPISKLNQLRRDCISKLEEILLNRIHRKSDVDLSQFLLERTGNLENVTRKEKNFSILLNNLSEDYNYSNLKNIDRIYVPLKYFYMPKFNAKIAEITNVADTYIYMPSILKDSVLDNILQGLDKILLLSFSLSLFKIF